MRLLDGERLQRAVVAGCLRVIRHQRELDEINVFPVPDGDTGTNLAFTLRGVADAGLRKERPSVGEAAAALAEAALMSARGNSGSIFAEFLNGLAQHVAGLRVVDAGRLATAALAGAAAARDAVTEPREGTILTVSAEWARALDAAARGGAVLTAALTSALSKAREALRRTPEQLDALKRAGVVDAGAQGFVRWIEGLLEELAHGQANLDERLERRVTPHPDLTAAPAPEFRYCCECRIEGRDLDRAEVRRRIAACGDSLVVTGSAGRLRVHIHTDDPEDVFARLAALGAIAGRKAEDMAEQHRAGGHAVAHGAVALVVDSACDLPEEFLTEHGIRVVPVEVLIGERSLRDKLDITPAMLYRMMERDGVMPKTSQPPPSAFKEVFESALASHQAVLYIGLAAALSGTFQAAGIAARMLDPGRIRLIDSRCVSAGTGLLVAEAAAALERGESLETVAAGVEAAARRVRIFLSVPSTRYLERGGRVGPIQGALARMLGIRPLLSVDREGRAAEAGRALGERRARRRILELVEGAAGSGTQARFSVAHANALDAATWYYRGIAARFPDAPVTVVDAAPSIGAHAGPGVAGVAVLPGPGDGPA